MSNRRIFGWLLVALMAECFLAIALYWPKPAPQDISRARVFRSQPAPPIERHVNAFALLVALPTGVLIGWCLKGDDL